MACQRIIWNISVLKISLILEDNRYFELALNYMTNCFAINRCLKSIYVTTNPVSELIVGPCDVLNGNCEQICIPIGLNRLCQCEYGFQLDADTRTCSSGKSFTIQYNIFSHAVIFSTMHALDTSGLKQHLQFSYKHNEFFWIQQFTGYLPHFVTIWH